MPIPLPCLFVQLCLCLTFWGLVSPPLNAQMSADYEVLIQTNDGRSIRGRSVSQDSTGYRFWVRKHGRETLVQNSDIKSVDTIRLWAPPVGSYLNPLGPNNGFGLKKGEVYWRNYMLSSNFAAVGITDNFSLGAGIDIASSLTAEDDHTLTYAIAPKFTIPVKPDLVSIGIGGIFLNLPDYEGGFSTHNLYYTAISIGSQHRNVSAGITMVQVEGSLRASPVYTLNANWFINAIFGVNAELITGAPIEGSVILPGIQLMGRWVDFGISYPMGWFEDDRFLSPLPVASLSFKFSR